MENPEFPSFQGLHTQSFHLTSFLKWAPVAHAVKHTTVFWTILFPPIPKCRNKQAWYDTRAVVLESGLETFFYRLGLVLDSLVFGLGLVSDLVIGLAKCSSWSRPSPVIYAFFSLSKQNH